MWKNVYCLFISHSNSGLIPYLLWKTNDKTSAAIDLIFDFSATVNYHILGCDISNRFSVGLPWEILDILFTRLDLEAAGNHYITNLKLKVKMEKFVILLHQKIV